MNKVDFIKRVIELNPNTRFQYWFNGYPSKTWYSYNQIIKKYPNLFKVNKQMLRTGIENDSLSELRIDIDSKDTNGNKSFEECEKICKFICNKLDENNITQYSVYTSGGYGLHIQFLYYNKEFQEFESQKVVRELVCKFLGIYNFIDTQLLSNNQMLTCEGYEKRNSKTREIKRLYIGRGKKELNGNYFNEINTFSRDIIEYVKTNYPKYDKIHTKGVVECNSQKKSEFVSANSLNCQIKGIRKPSDRIIKQHLTTFAKLYNEKGLSSTNKYYVVVITYLYTSTQDRNKTIDYFNKFFQVFGAKDNLTCSRTQKVDTIISNFHLGKTKIFFENEYLTKDEFYTEYYSLFSNKNVVSENTRRGLNGFSNNERTIEV